MESASLWHSLPHPFFWLSEADVPRLKTNAQHEFWAPKFACWRRELKALTRLEITTPVVDFHLGTNKAALKAALCHVVDGDEHSGRLVGTFLSALADFYRKGPDWRALMAANGPGQWTGNQWGGLSGNHIVDPQLWLSCVHLYDVIFGKGFVPPEDAQTFEDMMALCHQVSCLHEDLCKMDNNRSVWLCAGGYASTLFDPDAARAVPVRERLRNSLYRFLETIFDDGSHYEIGPYAPATIAAMQVFARCVRGAEGADFFRIKVNGTGLEEFYRAFAGTLIPGSSLRLPGLRDRVNHWDSLAAGYAEYGVPELGWALSRMAERDWVPMFQHWPQGMEFYVWTEPRNPRPPRWRHSHFPSGGMAILRTSWENDAASLFFRYGFQGSSHGGGLDKLNFELTCGDEPLVAEPMLTERSHDKNVVLVDGVDQEQCSGRVLYSDLREDSDVQVLSAEGGFGEWPQRDFLHDPRAEINYWCTKNAECFPGVCRMRRTVALVGGCVFVVRDTLRALDAADHDYQWLLHTFARVNWGRRVSRRVLSHQPRKRWVAEKVAPVLRHAAFHQCPEAEWKFHAPGAEMSARFSVFGAVFPDEVGVTTDPAPYAYAGSSETGQGFDRKMLTRLHLMMRGRDVTLSCAFVPYPAGHPPEAEIVRMHEASLEQFEMDLLVRGQACRLEADEGGGTWRLRT